VGNYTKFDMEKRWVLGETDQDAVTSLKEDLGVSPIVCDLLVKRGINSFEQAKYFFRPSLEKLHDPMLMKDMDKALDRLEASMRNNERIMIYGDYDVDGTTAVSLVYGFFKEFYYNLEHYIPDRYEEGYGVSFQSIDYAQKQGISLIIALDCGIKAIDKVAYAKEKGVDFIIGDHHRPGEKLPDAVAVLDPKREDCTYPYKELTGCGIGFKLVQAFAQRNDVAFEKVSNLLDLVVVSIAADIVPITGENRILAYYGMRRLNEKPRPGLRSLIELSGAKRPLRVSEIVFFLAPRINAAGRMDSGQAAVQLLIAQENLSAFLKADTLDVHNKERREIDKTITEEALHLISDNEVLMNKKSIVLYDEHWHKGVIGIVASRMIENFYKPSIILTSADDEFAAGSARSVKGFDIYNAIAACEPLLEQFGGHKYAAGLTIKKTRIPEFIEKFERIVAETIEENMLTPEILVDAELEVEHMTLNFYKVIEQFEPFGPSNLQPIFVTRGLRDTGYSSIVGQTNRHLKISAVKDGLTVNGIAFNQAHKFDFVKNQYFDVCYSLELNEWRGKRTIQMTIKDIKPHEEWGDFSGFNETM